MWGGGGLCGGGCAPRRQRRIVSTWESLNIPGLTVKCLPIRNPRMTWILRDCVKRKEVDRASMRDVVECFSLRKCLVKLIDVLSSTPRTQ
jgi:hypothetical protein